jgi:DNA-binding HxlR family transcriptional regulator
MTDDVDAATERTASRNGEATERTASRNGEATERTASRNGEAVGPEGDRCPIATDGHPAADFFSLLGRAHAMRVLALLATSDRDVWRFGEIEAELGVSPNTLSERLSELVEAGLLTRTAYAEIPPRVEYAATERARELDPVFRELRDWMRRHGLE